MDERSEEENKLDVLPLILHQAESHALNVDRFRVKRDDGYVLFDRFRRSDNLGFEIHDFAVPASQQVCLYRCNRN